MKEIKQNLKEEVVRSGAMKKFNSLKEKDKQNKNYKKINVSTQRELKKEQSSSPRRLSKNGEKFIKIHIASQKN